MTITRATLIINLLGLATLQVALIIDPRLVLHWLPLGWIWSISVASMIGAMLLRNYDRQDQL